MYFSGNVRDRVGNGRQYVVQWPEGPCQVQVCHYYMMLSKPT